MQLHAPSPSPASAPAITFRGLEYAGIGLLLLHLLIRDRIPGLSTIYLLTPFPFIGLLFLPSAIRCLMRREQMVKGVMLIDLAIFIAAWHFLAPVWLFRQPDPAPGAGSPVKVVLWTPDNYEFTTVDQGFRLLADFDADVIGLVEGNVDHGRQQARAAELFPDYHMALLDHGMLLLVRGELLSSKPLFVGDGRGALVICELQVKGMPLTLALYDQHSSPLYSRGASIEQLALVLSSASQRNLILMGDFNGPHTAASLAPLRERLRPVFNQIRNRNPYTWPEALPFLAFDQVWLSSSLAATDVTLHDTGQANHRLVEFIVHPAHR